MEITNCIFAGNATGIYDDESSDSGRRIRLTRTIVANNTTNVYSKYGKGIVLGDGFSTTNDVSPLFQANSCELILESFAVNNALDLGHRTDALGRTRPRLGGFDIGALELQPHVGTVVKIH